MKEVNGIRKREKYYCLINFWNNQEKSQAFRGRRLKAQLKNNNPSQKKINEPAWQQRFLLSSLLHPQYWNICWINEWNEAGTIMHFSLSHWLISPLGYPLWSLNWTLHLFHFHSFRPIARLSLSSLCLCTQVITNISWVALKSKVKTNHLILP